MKKYFPLAKSSHPAETDTPATFYQRPASGLVFTTILQEFYVLFTKTSGRQKEEAV